MERHDARSAATSVGVPQAKVLAMPDTHSRGLRLGTVAVVLAAFAMTTAVLAFWTTEGYLHWGLPRLRSIESALGRSFATFILSAVSVPASVLALMVVRVARRSLRPTSIEGHGRLTVAMVVAWCSLPLSLFAPGLVAGFLLLFALGG